MWSRPPSMPWCSCAIVLKWPECAASRWRNSDGDAEKDSHSVLPLGHRDASEAQAGDQGPGLYAPQSDCGARGQRVDPRHGEGSSAPGPDIGKLEIGDQCSEIS